MRRKSLCSNPHSIEWIESSFFSSSPFKECLWCEDVKEVKESESKHCFFLNVKNRVIRMRESKTKSTTFIRRPALLKLFTFKPFVSNETRIVSTTTTTPTCRLYYYYDCGANFYLLDWARTLELSVLSWFLTLNNKRKDGTYLLIYFPSSSLLLFCRKLFFRTIFSFFPHHSLSLSPSKDRQRKRGGWCPTRESEQNNNKYKLNGLSI